MIFKNVKPNLNMDYGNNNRIQGESFVQIEVTSIGAKSVTCNLCTGLLCPEIQMKRDDYEYLLSIGFFKQIEKDRDTNISVILATTELYKIPTATTTG